MPMPEALLMTLSASATKRSFSIPSDAASGKQAVDELLGELARCEWDENDVFGVHLAFEEALVNAIKHGNGGDPRKQVHIRYAISPERAEIEITDEGPGFDPTTLPDPSDVSNLEKASGRGLMLIRMFMDEVSFNERGNEIRMVKRSAPA